MTGLISIYSRVDIQLTHAHNVGCQISKANGCGGDEAKVEGVKECPILRIDTYIISTQAQERGECEWNVSPPTA